jgi:hypothetical protein
MPKSTNVKRRTARKRAGGRAGPGSADRVAGISDDAVTKATGKSWDQWCTLLDTAGAARRTHREIAQHLHEQHGVPGWWAQMVTVGYEQARGRREAHETPTGFSASCSRVIAAPLPDVYARFENARRRSAWLPGAPMTIRKATKDKSMRIMWQDGGRATSVEVNFYAKGDGKCQVALQHGKLAGARDVARLKRFWAERLDALRDLAQGKPGGLAPSRARPAQRSVANRR